MSVAEIYRGYEVPKSIAVILSVFVFFAVAVPAAIAQQPTRPAQKADDPLVPLKRIYAGETAIVDKPAPFSKRLKALEDAASKRSKELNEPVAGLDFDFRINGQDFEPGTFKSVRYKRIERKGDRASVAVTFKNGTAQELRYNLVRENGQWLIDEVRNEKKDPWVLSKLYEEGAKAGR